MGYGKRTGFIKITAAAITLVFGLTLFLGFASPFFSSKNKSGEEEKASDEKAWLQQQQEIPADLLEKTGGTAKYMTISQEGNVDIGVNYLNPMTGDKDTLTFEIIIGTHSVDLTKYKDIRKYVELRTDSGVVISDGFEWNLKYSESHHIIGSLKIKNSIAGNPIVGPDTKSFRLVFKDIAGVGKREHVYEGDKLK